MFVYAAPVDTLHRRFVNYVIFLSLLLHHHKSFDLKMSIIDLIIKIQSKFHIGVILVNMWLKKTELSGAPLAR